MTSMLEKLVSWKSEITRVALNHYIGTFCFQMIGKFIKWKLFKLYCFSLVCVLWSFELEFDWIIKFIPSQNNLVRYFLLRVLFKLALQTHDTLGNWKRFTFSHFSNIVNIISLTVNYHIFIWAFSLIFFIFLTQKINFVIDLLLCIV